MTPPKAAMSETAHFLFFATRTPTIIPITTHTPKIIQMTYYSILSTASTLSRITVVKYKPRTNVAVAETKPTTNVTNLFPQKAKSNPKTMNIAPSR